MSIVVDMERPDRRRRARDLLIGLALAAPIAGVLALWAIPALVHSVMGGARDFDSRLREQDRYMQELCATAMELPRDEELCACALAVEYPSLDCQDRFQAWLVARQAETCADQATHRASLSFCTCVEILAQAASDASDTQSDGSGEGYARCAALPDALPPPPVSSL